MAQQSCLRKAWGPGLLERVSTCFKTVADPVAGRAFALKDHLMAGLAVFSLEYPSRFQFDSEACGDEAVHTTLTVLFGISDSPSDSGLCKCHDRVDPRSLRPAFKALFPTLQRGSNSPFGVIGGFQRLGDVIQAVV